MSPELTDKDHRPSIYSVRDFNFPYLYKFPGQDKNEQILYATREDKKMLWARISGIVVVGSIVILMMLGLANYLLNYVKNGIIIASIVSMISLAVLVVMGLSIAWVTITWKKTIGLITTYRLIKMVQITPWTQRIQTLSLKEIVDTSSETRHMIDALFGLSTLTARSSATSSGLATNDLEGGLRINKKYFYFENIQSAQDLGHYLNKLLHVLPETNSEKMATFRPFLPNLKGDTRREFMKNYPNYWS